MGRKGLLNALVIALLKVWLVTASVRHDLFRFEYLRLIVEGIFIERSFIEKDPLLLSAAKGASVLLVPELQLGLSSFMAKGLALEYSMSDGLPATRTLIRQLRFIIDNNYLELNDDSLFLLRNCYDFITDPLKRGKIMDDHFDMFKDAIVIFEEAKKLNSLIIQNNCLLEVSFERISDFRGLIDKMIRSDYWKDDIYSGREFLQFILKNPLELDTLIVLLSEPGIMFKFQVENICRFYLLTPDEVRNKSSSFCKDLNLSAEYQAVVIQDLQNLKPMIGSPEFRLVLDDILGGPLNVITKEFYRQGISNIKLERFDLIYGEEGRIITNLLRGSIVGEIREELWNSLDLQFAFIVYLIRACQNKAPIWQIQNLRIELQKLQQKSLDELEAEFYEVEKLFSAIVNVFNRRALFLLPNGVLPWENFLELHDLYKGFKNNGRFQNVVRILREIEACIRSISSDLEIRYYNKEDPFYRSLYDLIPRADSNFFLPNTAFVEVEELLWHVFYSHDGFISGMEKKLAEAREINDRGLIEKIGSQIRHYRNRALFLIRDLEGVSKYSFLNAQDDPRTILSEASQIIFDEREKLNSFIEEDLFINHPFSVLRYRYIYPELKKVVMNVIDGLDGEIYNLKKILKYEFKSNREFQDTLVQGITSFLYINNEFESLTSFPIIELNSLESELFNVSKAISKLWLKEGERTLEEWNSLEKELFKGLQIFMAIKDDDNLTKYIDLK